LFNKGADTEPAVNESSWKSFFTAKKEETKNLLGKKNQFKYKGNYVVINELTAGNYFGEIAAISNMRRSASVIAISPMVIGKIKIDKFRTFMYSNNNF